MHFFFSLLHWRTPFVTLPPIRSYRRAGEYPDVV